MSVHCGDSLSFCCAHSYKKDLIGQPPHGIDVIMVNQALTVTPYGRYGIRIAGLECSHRVDGRHVLLGDLL